LGEEEKSGDALRGEEGLAGGAASSSFSRLSPPVLKCLLGRRWKIGLVEVVRRLFPSSVEDLLLTRRMTSREEVEEAAIFGFAGLLLIDETLAGGFLS